MWSHCRRFHCNSVGGVCGCCCCCSSHVNSHVTVLVSPANGCGAAAGGEQCPSGVWDRPPAAAGRGRSLGTPLLPCLCQQGSLCGLVVCLFVFFNIWNKSRLLNCVSLTFLWVSCWLRLVSQLHPWVAWLDRSSRGLSSQPHACRCGIKIIWCPIIRCEIWQRERWTVECVGKNTWNNLYCSELDGCFSHVSTATEESFKRQRPLAEEEKKRALMSRRKARQSGTLSFLSWVVFFSSKPVEHLCQTLLLSLPGLHPLTSDPWSLKFRTVQRAPVHYKYWRDDRTQSSSSFPLLSLQRLSESLLLLLLLQQAGRCSAERHWCSEQGRIAVLLSLWQPGRWDETGFIPKETQPGVKSSSGAIR